MKLFGIVINVCGLEPTVKLVEKDVFDWVSRPNIEKATIDIVPVSVLEKFEAENKHMKYFREGTNELVKPSNYEDFKAEVAPAFKSGFDSLEEAKAYAKETGNTYVDAIIKYIQA